MNSRDATRLLPLFEDVLGGSVRPVSGIEISAWRNDVPWSPSLEIALFGESVLAWLVAFSLCVATFHEARPHAQTKLFRDALVKMRDARVERVSRLNIRLRSGASSLAAPDSTFWQDEQKALLYEDTGLDWLLALAGPPAEIIEHGDIRHRLRLAFASRKGVCTRRRTGYSAELFPALNSDVPDRFVTWGEIQLP
jgi:hypothetical protein